MRAIILAVALAGALLVSVPTAADIDSFCAAMSELAEAIMDRRQNGEPMRKVLEDISWLKHDAPKEYELARNIVIDAYQAEQWAGTAARERASAEYGNEFAIGCFEVFGNE